LPSWPAIATANWGDYDNEGQLDILLLGAKAFVCKPNGASYEINLETSGFADGAVEWGDADNDGRLDILATGFFPADVLLAQNFTPQTNSPPLAPTGLVAVSGGDRAFFRWNAATDAQTPGPGLSYNLRVGKSPGACDVVSPLGDVNSGKRFVAARGPIQGTNWFLRELVAGQRYYWSVQAIDTAFAGGVWAAESGFIYEPIRLNPPLQLASGDVQLTFTNRSNQPCHIWASTNLKDWEDLGPAEALDGINWGFTAKANIPQRFYRLQIGN
jgi:hypothetical protein